MSIQVLDDNTRPSTSQMFGQAFANAGQAAGQGMGQLLVGRQAQQNKMKQEAQENAFFKQNFGIDAAGLNPEIKKEILSKMLQGQNQQAEYGLKEQNAVSQFQREQEAKTLELQGKRKEAIAPYQNALGVINQMRSLGKKGNLGRGSHVKSFFGGDTARDVGEYEQLGKSLISLASTIPIRNQQEFKTLADKLIDASLSDSEREGVLTAMERIVNNSLNAAGGEMMPQQQMNQEKPDVKSFWE